MNVLDEVLVGSDGQMQLAVCGVKFKVNCAVVGRCLTCLTMRYGTASRNFLTRTLLLDSVRNRMPWPSHSAFVSLLMSLSWIQIRILDGFMFITE